MNLFAELQRTLGVALVFIAHDLAVVSPRWKPWRTTTRPVTTRSAPTA
ncbi:hypothetical protein [Nonomuraea sp. 10N515B]